MLKHVLVAAALIVSAREMVISQDASTMPEGWVVISQPVGDNWQCANSAREEWAVTAGPNNTVQISPYNPSGEVRLALPEGELIGTNQGEFGGKIEWVTRDAKRHMVLSDVNPVSLTTLGEDVFVASGLAHLGLDSGAILRVRREKNGDWQSSKVIDLGEAPNASIRVDDASWVVLTNNGITRIDLRNLTQERIYRNKNWWQLYGNSIAPLGDSWMIGARRAVIRLTPIDQGFSEDWLVSKHCRLLVAPKCECKP